ncbi:MAG: protein-glutamate O-methyltransferase CheR [bacterium]|nr:MAG: protein-glutamate O-methyltransferase CheR [bacterium]
MLFESAVRIELTDEEFRLLAAFIYDHAGLYFDGGSRFLLESRLQNRLKEHHFDSFLKYYHYLLYHQDRLAELNRMIDIVTTNETYFYRERNQLDAFAEEILPEMAQRNSGKKSLRIWSAGCSTGEEPYTLAILCSESGLFDDSWQVDIIGTDISQRVLKTARKAVFSQSSFRATDGEAIDRYFDRTEDGKYSLDDSIRNMVHFGHLNLMDEKMMGLIRECDIIMCRNVIIYFDQNAKARAINSFYRKLVPGGYLLLGHSESLMNITTVFKLKHLTRVMVYQKPEGTQG